MKILKLHYVLKDKYDELTIISSSDINMSNLKNVLYFNKDKRKCESFINKYLKKSNDIYVGLYDDLDNFSWMCTMKKYDELYKYYNVVIIGTHAKVKTYLVKNLNLKI